MYDIRTTIKVVAKDAITMGMSVYLDANGANRCDADWDVVHGWALTTVAVGDMLTVVTTCRMEVDTVQTPGARIFSGNEGAGSAPSTTLLNTTPACGFAITTTQIFCNVPTPTADG